MTTCPRCGNRLVKVIGFLTSPPKYRCAICGHEFSDRKDYHMNIHAQWSEKSLLHVDVFIDGKKTATVVIDGRSSIDRLEEVEPIVKEIIKRLSNKDKPESDSPMPIPHMRGLRTIHIAVPGKMVDVVNQDHVSVAKVLTEHVAKYIEVFGEPEAKVHPLWVKQCDSVQYGGPRAFVKRGTEDEAHTEAVAFGDSFEKAVSRATIFKAVLEARDKKEMIVIGSDGRTSPFFWSNSVDIPGSKCLEYHGVRLIWSIPK